MHNPHSLTRLPFVTAAFLAAFSLVFGAMDGLASPPVQTVAKVWAAATIAQDPTTGVPGGAVAKPDAPGDRNAPAPASRAKPGEAQAAVKLARERLLKQPGVTARLVETVTVRDSVFKAEGRYLQGDLSAAERFLRIELKFTSGGSEGALLEVCDGDILWTRQKVGADVVITRRNVTEILKVAKKKNIPVQFLEFEFGLGGIPELLGSLDDAIEFTDLKQNTLRDRPVVVVQGKWRPEIWKQITGGRNPAPPWVPEVCRLYLDEETGFPHWILYLRRVPDRDRLKSLLSLEFFDVHCGEAPAASEFKFTPPEREPQVDITDQYLQRLEAAAPSEPENPPARPGSVFSPAPPK
jgi:hypothetical protein